VKFVRGVGPRVSEMLAFKGIETAEDLLYHLPFRYEDRQNPRSLDELVAGEVVSVIGEVRGAALLRTRRRKQGSPGSMPAAAMSDGQRWLLDWTEQVLWTGWAQPPRSGLRLMPLRRPMRR